MTRRPRGRPACVSNGGQRAAPYNGREMRRLRFTLAAVIESVLAREKTTAENYAATVHTAARISCRVHSGPPLLENCNGLMAVTALKYVWKCERLIPS